MQYVGGLRARLIRQSVYMTINDALLTLDWFNPGRRHKPVTFVAYPVNPDTEVPFNTAALSDEDIFESEDEVGSQFAEHRWTFYVDFYAESDALGLHFQQDVRAILSGRMDAVGRNYPKVDVYDWTMATPPLIFTVQIENVVGDRAHDFPKRYQQHWYAVRFDVVDNYGNEFY